jgi:LmbE family N-acetylglucosaminyl deacetylase
MLNSNTILILAPHPDDGELGCGATISRLKNQGSEVFYAVFSPCNKSLPEGFSENQIYNELDDALSVLGIDNNHILKFNFPVRDFPQYRQQILEELIVLRKNIKPDLVFIPNSNDIHQDHQTIASEAKRAFKHVNILGYELPWNNMIMQTNFFVKVEQSDLDKKVKALSKYTSQQQRIYFKQEFIESLAKVRGARAGAMYAEAFEFINAVV